MKADLHLHTTASDGRLSPQELVERAAHLGLEVIAITDHDSTSGIPSAFEAARSFPNLQVIPGIEIDTDLPDHDVHILGYFIDYENVEFANILDQLRNSRHERGQKMVARLAELGMQIEWERVLELASGGAIGRPHIAQAMLERGYISNFKEAFTQYIGRNCVAYVKRAKVTPLEAVTLIVKANGLPFLAHPADIKNLESFVNQLQKAGLAGIEVYYANYSAEVIERLRTVADKFGLVSSGGSDYHGLDNTIGANIGTVDIPRESIDQLILLGKQIGTVI
jgi:predicted metal-dependent phosphoesterase TrpH